MVLSYITHRIIYFSIIYYYYYFFSLFPENIIELIQGTHMWWMIQGIGCFTYVCQDHFIHMYKVLNTTIIDVQVTWSVNLL